MTNCQPNSSYISRIFTQINDWEGSQYRYCNEFLVDSDTLDPEEALEFLATMGDCELCVGSTPKFKVHVHSNTPDKVLAYFLERGQISEVFIHNMQLQSAERTESLIAQVLAVMAQEDYDALDVDFEYLPPQMREAYAAFIASLRRRLAPVGKKVLVALAPKTSADQPGLLYEAHDYALLGAAADAVLLMTYEWGYAGSAPMAVAPIPQVRRVLDYAVTAIARQKIYLGVPTYGYDWPLPYVQGVTRAKSLSPVEATALAARYGAEIRYDDRAQAPHFRYSAVDGTEHEVWFEDARSILAKLDLVAEYGFRGVGYWNLMRPFPQNLLLLSQKFSVLSGI